MSQRNKRKQSECSSPPKDEPEVLLSSLSPLSFISFHSHPHPSRPFLFMYYFSQRKKVKFVATRRLADIIAVNTYSWTDYLSLPDVLSLAFCNVTFFSLLMPTISSFDVPLIITLVFSFFFCDYQGNICTE